jgi:hypothetical protein
MSLICKNKDTKLGKVVHICNLSTMEAETGRLQVPGWPELHCQDTI